jgi:hypothetical protein
VLREFGRHSRRGADTDESIPNNDRKISQRGYCLLERFNSLVCYPYFGSFTVALFGQNAVGGLHGDARAGSKIKIDWISVHT